MNINEIRWIWQQPTWPHFEWQDSVIQPMLQSVHFKQGVLVGKASHPEQILNLETALDTLVQNIITSSAIEGERLNADSLRSSLAKRLGLQIKHPYPTSSRTEGLAQMILDAIQNVDVPLTLERLFQWHRWLFPTDKFSIVPIQAGQLRGAEPMQVVSGRIDKPTVHYEAPPRAILEKELHTFIDWFNQTHADPSFDPILHAAICHLWFVVIHPFEDGNGRIGRALTDLALAQADQRSICLYTMSSTILAHRADYYQALKNSKQMDITAWLVWFLKTLDLSLQSSIDKIDHTLTKIRFWQKHKDLNLSVEQRKVLNRLLDAGETGFEQGINASQYQKVAKVSKATATRHLTELLEKGCIVKLEGGGRSTRYQINNTFAKNCPV